jgi:CRISPR-associated protein Csb2
MMKAGKAEMPFAIVADLPLGTYHGAGHDSEPERLPSVARLHSALLCAAGFGPRAVAVAAGDGLEACDEDLAALRWLEENPPDSVRIPSLQINVTSSIAYRDDGTIHRSKSVASIRKLAKRPGGGTAVDGHFAWIWRQKPPPQVLDSLEQLCPEVGYLGTTESPVRLAAVTAGDMDATADLDETADMFSLNVEEVMRPLPGRTAELIGAHQMATGKPPTVARDRIRTAERSLSSVPPRRALEPARYRQRQRPVSEVPWPIAMVLPFDRVVSAEYRVAWAVAAHRALVKLLGYGAPPLVTGIYPPGQRRPANRLALQVLGTEMPCLPMALGDPDKRTSALLILVPAGADVGDLRALERAVSGLTWLGGPGGSRARVDQDRMGVLDGGQFWLPPASGQVRLWETVPAAVPDTRGHEGWTFADAAMLSLGFVWQDYHGHDVKGRGAERDCALTAAVSGLGAQVMQARPERTIDVGRYVHKVNEHAVVRPYSAVLDLGGLGGDQVVQAIGQSRHLGGGLLVPRDVPAGEAGGHHAAR